MSHLDYLLSHTHPLLRVIQLQAWPSLKHSSLYPQLKLQQFTWGVWVADKSCFYVGNIIWSKKCQLPLIASVPESVFVSFSCRYQRVCLSAQPAIRRAFAPKTNFPDTQQDFRQASPRRQQCYQLPPRSQPAVSPV